MHLLFEYKAYLIPISFLYMLTKKIPSTLLLAEIFGYYLLLLFYLAKKVAQFLFCDLVFIFQF